MKLHMRLIGAAALAVAISVAAQQWTARSIDVIAGQSTPTNAEQGQTPDSAGPTLKETSDWLKPTLEAYGGGVGTTEAICHIPKRESQMSASITPAGSAIDEISFTATVKRL